MKVKEKYAARGAFNLTTAQLIERGSSDRDGQIESLEAKVLQLAEVLAGVIDRMRLADSDILKLTGCEFKYDIADEEG